MSILGAIYAGQRSILRAKESIDQRAVRLSHFGHSSEDESSPAEDIVGMKVDRAQVQAGSRIVKVSDEISQTLLKLTK